MNLPKLDAVQRVRVGLPGGYVLSLVQGDGVYSGDTSVEAMVFNKDGDPVTETMGWVNGEKLAKLLAAMQRRAKKEAADV